MRGRGWGKAAPKRQVSPGRAPELLETVGAGAEVPLLQDVHLVLGVLEQEGARGALAGLGTGHLGRLGLGGAGLPALLAARVLGVVLGFPQLFFVLHPPVLEPGFHLRRAGGMRRNETKRKKEKKIKKRG